MKRHENVNVAKSTISVTGMCWEHRAHILHPSEDCEPDRLFKNNAQAAVTLSALKKIAVFAPRAFSCEYVGLRGIRYGVTDLLRCRKLIRVCASVYVCIHASHVINCTVVLPAVSVVGEHC